MGTLLFFLFGNQSNSKIESSNVLPWDIRATYSISYLKISTIDLGNSEGYAKNGVDCPTSFITVPLSHTNREVSGEVLAKRTVMERVSSIPLVFALNHSFYMVPYSWAVRMLDLIEVRSVPL